MVSVSGKNLIKVIDKATTSVMKSMQISFTFLEVSSQAISYHLPYKIFNCNKLSINMSAESDDAPLVDVELSHSSDGSHEHSLQDFQYPSTKPSATIKPYYPNGIPHLPAADEQSLIPDLDPTEELSLMTKSGWTSEPVSSAQPALTTQLTDDSSPKTETFIHPISGGAITWKDHNEFVFRKGKARGPRVPAPTLPENYKSKGSLKNLDFSKLRGNNVCIKLLFDSLATRSFETDKCKG